MSFLPGFCCPFSSFTTQPSTRWWPGRFRNSEHGAEVDVIDRIGTVSVFVSDQDRAKEFYTNTLGLELRADAPLYPGAATRWVAVAPPGAETEIILYLPDENWEHYGQVVGKPQALTFNVTDMAALYKELKARDVVFVQEPDNQPWGTFAIIQDSEGNHLLLVEQPKK